MAVRAREYQRFNSRTHHTHAGREGGRAAFRSLVAWQIDRAATALVPCGTTGESPTLSHDRAHAGRANLRRGSQGRVPVIAGAGSNSTSEAIMLSSHAKKVGADAVLSVTGYYNRPSQEGLYRHFAAMAEAVDIPILLYNIPGRAIVEHLGRDDGAPCPGSPTSSASRTRPPI